MKKELYSMEPFIDNKISERYDYFILSSGIDNRAYEVLSKFDPNDIGKVIFIHFNERLHGLSEDNQLFDYQKFIFDNIQEIYSEIKNPNSCLKDLEDNNFTNTSRIAIDITCLTKPYFYFIIKLLRERFQIDFLSAYYTEPKSYTFPEGLFSSFHSNSGPLTPWEIPGYSGFEKSNSERKLVILLGFDGDLSKELNEDVSPNKTIVVNGFPSYTPKFKDISLIANERLVTDQNILVKYARANNPFEVYNLLEQIKNEQVKNEKKIEYFINIAPLGTKPMALGACLFALHNPEVRVVYPLPESYKDSYSDQIWNSWSYKLPLSN